MQYSWLEKMTKEGQVRTEVRDQIYHDCAILLEKLGTVTPKEQFIEGMTQYGKSMVNSMGNTAIMMGVFSVAKSILDRVSDSKMVSAILKNRSELVKSQEGTGYKDKVGARFDELVRMAPHIAAIPDLSKKYVLGALHSGFTDADAQRFASIPKSYGDTYKNLEAISSSVEGKRQREKRAGEAAADILNIVKEAGLGGAARGAARGVKGATKDLGKELLYSVAALTGAHLVLGTGIGTANAVMKHFDKKDLEEKLKSSFETAMRESDPTREQLHANKDKAHKAFQTLAHFAPTVATSPSAARAFMNSMISYDIGTPLGTVKDLSDIEKNLRGSHGSAPFLEGLGKSFETTGAGKAFGEAVKITMTE